MAESSEQNWKKEKRDQRRAIAIQLHCEELMERNALEITIETSR